MVLPASESEGAPQQVKSAAIYADDDGRGWRLAVTSAHLYYGCDDGSRGDQLCPHPGQCIVRPCGPTLPTVAMGSWHAGHTSPVRLGFSGVVNGFSESNGWTFAS